MKAKKIVLENVFQFKNKIGLHTTHLDAFHLRKQTFPYLNFYSIVKFEPLICVFINYLYCFVHYYILTKSDLLKYLLFVFIDTFTCD